MHAAQVVIGTLLDLESILVPRSVHRSLHCHIPLPSWWWGVTLPTIPSQPCAGILALMPFNR